MGKERLAEDQCPDTLHYNQPDEPVEDAEDDTTVSSMEYDQDEEISSEVRKIKTFQSILAR